MSEYFKVVLVGDSSVGKTSIIEMFSKSTFNERQDTTVGPQFTSRFVEVPETGQRIKLQIWDTAGQEKYRSVTPIYYRDAAAAVCVYDVTSKMSLDQAEKWINDLRQYAPKYITLAVAANKCDLHGQEEVSLEEGDVFRQKHNLEIF
jgi:Ras-related protein Rab-5C